MKGDERKSGTEEDSAQLAHLAKPPLCISSGQSAANPSMPESYFVLVSCMVAQSTAGDTALDRRRNTELVHLAATDQTLPRVSLR